MKIAVAKAPPLSPELKERFAANLARCREGAGLSQEELGYRASLHRTEIGLIERGKRVPRIDTTVRIAGSLGVALETLVVGIRWQPGLVIVQAGEWLSESTEPPADGETS